MKQFTIGIKMETGNEVQIDVREAWNFATGQDPTVARVTNVLGQHEVSITTADGQKIHFDNEQMIERLMVACGTYLAAIRNSNVSDDFSVNL